MGVPERSNGIASRAIGLVPTKVRILAPTLLNMKTIIDDKGNLHLWSKGDLNIQQGVVKEKDVKDGVIKTHLGKKLIVFESSFVDKLNKIKRGPAIMLPKDIGQIIANTGLNEKSRILDAGSGCGVLASFLGRISKNVISYEKNKEFFEIAKRNAEFLESDAKIKNEDVYEGISETNLDLITLDLLEPWKVVAHARKSLKSGGYLVSYLTNINQVIKLVENFDGFYLEKVCENIEREWEIDGLKVRPKNKGILHTGFLVFARRI